MMRYVVLISFSEAGIRELKDSISRADAFRSEAAKLGAKVESVFWTMGAYDGVFILSAPDEATAAAVVLNAGRGSAIRTTTLRAFDAEEFAKIVDKIA